MCARERIKGLIAPFVEYVREQFALQAEVKVGLEAAELWALLSQYRYFIASVHPSIRRPESLPPQQAGIWC